MHPILQLGLAFFVVIAAGALLVALNDLITDRVERRVRSRSGIAVALRPHGQSGLSKSRRLAAWPRRSGAGPVGWRAAGERAQCRTSAGHRGSSADAIR